jgi:pteridine reductase
MTSSSARPVALVTGGAQRIGRALCLAFAESGHDVVVHFHASETAAVATAADVEAHGVIGHAARADLASVSEARDLAAEAMATFGRVDVLVNNASAFHSLPLTTTDVETFDAATKRFLSLHVASPLALVHALAPELRARRGAVVNLGDAAGPRAGFSAYSASKVALASLTRSLARELAPEVRVNMVAPGAILPPAGSSPAGDDGIAQIVSRIPAGRFGTVEEVAEAVLFLATGPAFVTGQVLGVDGGQYG